MKLKQMLINKLLIFGYGYCAKALVSKFKKTLFLLTNDYDPTVAEAAFWAINEINANVNK